MSGSHIFIQRFRKQLVQSFYYYFFFCWYKTENCKQKENKRKDFFLFDVFDSFNYWIVYLDSSLGFHVKSLQSFDQLFTIPQSCCKISYCWFILTKVYISWKAPISIDFLLVWEDIVFKSRHHEIHEAKISKYLYITLLPRKC